MLHAMIMAGGGGTRFWPRSRQVRPKQFLPFSGDRTLLQGTVDRIAAQVAAERTWVLTNEKHRAEAAEQVPDSYPRPSRRRTGRTGHGACIGLGAALIARTDPDATIIVMPADHLIEPVQEFRRAVHAAEQFADDFPDALLTFGIEPTFPATGYGYIHRGERAGHAPGRLHFARTALQGEAEGGGSGRVRRLRRLLLEQRHLRLEARGDPRRIAGAQAGALIAAVRAHRRGLGDAEAGPRCSATNTNGPRRRASTMP